MVWKQGKLPSSSLFQWLLSLGTLGFFSMGTIQAVTTDSCSLYEILLFYHISFPPLLDHIYYFGSLKVRSYTLAVSYYCFHCPYSADWRYRLVKSHININFFNQVSFFYELTPLQFLPDSGHPLGPSKSCFYNPFRVYNCHLRNSLSICCSTVTRSH